MWAIEAIRPDPALPFDDRRKGTTTACPGSDVARKCESEWSFVVSVSTTIDDFLGKDPSALASFREGGKGARVALADFAARHFLACQQRNETTTETEMKIGGESLETNANANTKSNQVVAMIRMETLDEALLTKRQRTKSRYHHNRRYHPCVVERSDVCCPTDDDTLQITVRVRVRVRVATTTTTTTNEELSRERAEEPIPPAARSILGRVFPAADDPSFRDELLRHVACVVLQRRLRNHLLSTDAIAFVADGSILPRKSGASAAPMESPPAVPFKAPSGSRMAQSVSIDMGSLANYLSPSSLRTAGGSGNGSSLSTVVVLSGLVVPKGVTLICGGGYHGKSTLLQAISVGHYDKIPGDGRELCVSILDAVTVRAEDGRYVNNCNISAFISNLPTPPGVKTALDTEHFSTRDSSGSTSQAANVSEAIEFGAKALLVDEDISAANFMARDGRMRALVMDESITPLLYRVNGLYNTHGVSSVVVVGGVGDWLDVPHNVVLLDKYVVFDATEKAASISRQFSYGHVEYAGRGVVHRLPWEKKGTPKPRRPFDSVSERFRSDVVVSLLDGGRALALYRDDGAEEDPSGVVVDGKVSMDDDDEDEGCIDASRLEQLLGKRQLFAAGVCVAWILQNAPMHPDLGVKDLLALLDSKLENEGMRHILDALKETVTDGSPRAVVSKSMIQVLESVGYLERPRTFEVGQALTRIRGIRFEDMPMPVDEAEEAARLEEERRKKALADMWAKRRSKK